MIEIGKFLFPDDLEVNPVDIKNALFIGSCMTESYVKKFREDKPETNIDYVIFNNVADMPSSPPRPISEYDFQFVQVPLRHIIGDIVVDFSKFSNPDTNKDIIENGRNALRLMLESALKYNREHNLLTFVQNFIVPQTPVVAGLAARGSNFDLRAITQSLNEMINEIVSEYSNTYVVDAEMIASSMGKRYFFDDTYTFFTHGGFFFDDWHIFEGGRIETVPSIETISPNHLNQFFDAVWRAIEYNYRVINQIDSVKLVIFDLDDTLWRGIIGEHYGDDGQHPLTIGWPMGVHEAIHHLKARGILVAICSKNSPELVKARWNRAIPSEWISLDDFVCAEIGWGPKAEAIGRILSDVSLPPRNVVFVDDNPVERGAVLAAHPGIRVMGKNPLLTRNILLQSAETQTRIVTSESAMRDAMIRRQKVRENERQSMSREEFLQNLNCRLKMLHIENPNHEKFSRVFELLNKTNQFNTNGVRWTPADVHKHFNDGGTIIAFEVQDKYTSYGLVGVILVRGNEIVQFVMSCRVLGLEIETSALKVLVERMRAWGAEGPITASIIETDANIVSRDVYDKAGFTNEGNGHYILGTAPLGMPGQHLIIHWDGEAEPQANTNELAHATDDGQDLLPEGHDSQDGDALLEDRPKGLLARLTGRTN